ncbi:HAD family hydrolase [Jeotgalicoccus sp. FSL K6-3177]|uniref:HAD family hydrolase n=1 Tax=Jeotgalicoccus sp. FSL K6-3177 TaxID=2921494 RepID=UPI0030FD928D
MLVAEDSGNDFTMLETAYPTVIVANVHPELTGIEASDLLYRVSPSYAAGSFTGTGLY